MSNEIAFPRGGTPKVLLRTSQQHDISGIDNVKNSAERGTKRTRASFDKKVPEKVSPVLGFKINHIYD